MRSMTGYGAARETGDRFRCTVSVRSVNHRQLDVVVRLPEIARASERAVEKAVARRLARGRVEVQVELRRLADRGEAEVRIDESVLRGLEVALEAVGERPWLERRLGLGDLVRLPGVVEVERAEEWTPGDGAELVEVVQQAIGQLIEFREREGRELRAAVAAQIEELAWAAEQLRARRPAAVEALRQRLVARVEDLVGDVEIDPNRLAQEVALLAERADVEEELDRLDAHLGRLRECLDATEPVGRRLDFVSQEVLRELNTLGSKCRDDQMSALVLEAKLLCDRLREQAQNIE